MRRRPYRSDPKKQLLMWHQYRVELFPHYGQLCGIRDAFGNRSNFLRLSGCRAAVFKKG